MALTMKCFSAKTRGGGKNSKEVVLFIISNTVDLGSMLDFAAYRLSKTSTINGSCQIGE